MDIRISALNFEPTQGLHKSLETNECRNLTQLDQLFGKSTSVPKSTTGRRLFVVEAPVSSASFPRCRTLLHDRLGVPETVFERHRWGHTTFQFDETINCPRLPTVTRPRPVILCDPAPKSVEINKATVELKIKSFEGGYHGFIPEHVLGSKSERPRHLSMYDDLMYYFEAHADVLENLRDPVSVAMFPLKIVASHYCQLLGFVGHQTACMRSSGWAVQRRTQQEVDDSNQVETAWSQFKCPEYLEALSNVLDSLGIPQGNDPYEDLDVMEADPGPDRGPDRPNDWRSPNADFLYLHRDFRTRLADYARMTSSLAALNGMIGGRISILEARTAKSLTLVAMIFAPPACVASIFSIPSDIFGQQGPKFWWYWAAALPITVVVFLVTYVVHERDDLLRMWQARKPKVYKILDEYGSDGA